jgi:hypothetical protein
MNRSQQLWELVQHNTSRRVVVEYLKAVAQEMSLTSRGIKPSGRWESGSPSTQAVRERIIDHIGYTLASQDWINGESEPILDDLLGIVSQLDINPNDERLWRELLDGITDLR